MEKTKAEREKTKAEREKTKAEREKPISRKRSKTETKMRLFFYYNICKIIYNDTTNFYTIEYLDTKFVHKLSDVVINDLELVDSSTETLPNFGDMPTFQPL